MRSAALVDLGSERTLAWTGGGGKADSTVAPDAAPQSSVFGVSQKGRVLGAFTSPTLVKNDVASLAEGGDKMINKCAKLDWSVAL